MIDVDTNYKVTQNGKQIGVSEQGPFFEYNGWTCNKHETEGSIIWTYKHDTRIWNKNGVICFF